MMPAGVLQHTQSKLTAALAQLERIAQSDFPQPASREGLRLIRHALQARVDELEKVRLVRDRDVVQAVCFEALSALSYYLPLLGFFLRSTSIRNAFELAGPLGRLAELVVGSDTKIVLSSEWDYSPFVYPLVDAFPTFVLMGLPASESSNGLMISLSGHEIGHAVWKANRIASRLSNRVLSEIIRSLKTRHREHTSLHRRISKSQLYKWTLRQSEETFCDLIGLRIFHESFLEAFAYILAPRVGSHSPFYPHLQQRVNNLLRGAKYFKVPVPSSYAARFIDDRERTNPTNQFLLDIASTVLQKLFPVLQRICGQLAELRRIPKRNAAAIRECYDAFQMVVPPDEPKDLASIINAGWAVARSRSLWRRYPKIAKRRDIVLNELLIKSAEVLDVQARIREHQAR